MCSSTRKEELEQQKLGLEIRILARQERWEVWKSLTIVLVPALTLLALVGGGIKYFLDESATRRLRREEVYTLSLKELYNEHELIRIAAVTSLLSYIGKEKGYDERVAAVLAIQAVGERSVVVRQTILGNFRRWKPTDEKLFEAFLASVRKDLERVRTDLKGPAEGQERKALEDRKTLLAGVEQLLLEL